MRNKNTGDHTDSIVSGLEKVALQIDNLTGNNGDTLTDLNRTLNSLHNLSNLEEIRLGIEDIKNELNALRGRSYSFEDICDKLDYIAENHQGK